MQANPKRIKTIFTIAVLLVVILFVVSVILIVNIHITKNKIKEQNTQINNLKEQIELYKNQNNNPNQEEDEPIVTTGVDL